MWQDIETAPKDGGVLLSNGKDVALGSFAGHRVKSWSDPEFYWEWHVYPQVWEGDGDRGGLATVEFRPTHWQPLPSPPVTPSPSDAPK